MQFIFGHLYHGHLSGILKRMMWFSETVISVLLEKILIYKGNDKWTEKLAITIISIFLVHLLFFTEFLSKTRIGFFLDQQ